MKMENCKGGSLPLAPNACAFSATPSAGSSPQRPQVICVTGQMAAGKNYICSLLEKEGFVSIDLDKTAHTAISLCTEQILSAFSGEAEKRGISLVNGDGSLNRRALGEIVFSDKKLLARQEAIIYPKIIELTNQFIKENREKSVILNATVLFKTPELLSQCEKILFVTAGFFTRVCRAKKRDGLPLRQILARFKNQKNLLAEYKSAAASLGIPLEIVKN